VRQLGGGILEWTSPLGRIYIEQPPSLGVHFSPTTGARSGGHLAGDRDDLPPGDPPWSRPPVVEAAPF
jgi:hypothetical protein